MASSTISRMIRITALVALLVTAAIPQQPSHTIGPLSQIHPAPTAHIFPNGEKFVYEVEWRLWTAGTATLTMQNEGGIEKVLGVADATGAASVLFHVHDTFDARFDPRTFCSTSLTKHTEEGSRRLDTQIKYDYTRRKSLLDEKNLKTGGSKHTENDIPSCVTDVVSGIFYVASLPLAPGSQFVFPVNDGGRTVDVIATVEAREDVTVPAGRFQTVRVRPEATSGTLKDRGKMWVWYTDDGLHLPVQMRARMFWGTLTFRLKRIDR